MFATYPTYPRYRTLSLVYPLQRGEDVYALQNALMSCDFSPGVTDGILGPETAAAIRSFQHAAGIVMDGKAGGGTQKALALTLARRATKQYVVADGALHGQIEHESGYRLGNYSEQRPDGSWDIGVVQRNSAHLASIRSAYNVESSIMLLAKTIKEHYFLFGGLPDRRRWGLAQGAWNAPAFACYLAREEGADVPQSMTARPSGASRETFEGYIASVTTYLNL